MHPFFTTSVGAVVLLALLVRNADLAISAAISRSVVRAVAYGVVVILLLIALILVLGV